MLSTHLIHRSITSIPPMNFLHIMQTSPHPRRLRPRIHHHPAVTTTGFPGTYTPPRRNYIAVPSHPITSDHSNSPTHQLTHQLSNSATHQLSSGQVHSDKNTNKGPVSYSYATAYPLNLPTHTPHRPRDILSNLQMQIRRRTSCLCRCRHPATSAPPRCNLRCQRRGHCGYITPHAQAVQFYPPDLQSSHLLSSHLISSRRVPAPWCK